MKKRKKFTQEEIRFINDRLRDGVPMEKIAEEMGMALVTLYTRIMRDGLQIVKRVEPVRGWKARAMRPPQREPEGEAEEKEEEAT